MNASARPAHLRAAGHDVVLIDPVPRHVEVRLTEAEPSMLGASLHVIGVATKEGDTT